MLIDKLLKILLYVIVVLVLILVVKNVFADPFIVSSLQKYFVEGDFIKYKISWDNGITWDECGYEQIDPNTVRVKHDLVGIKTGSYNVLIKAYNLWGESAAVPFGFAKQLPLSPMDIQLSP